MYERLLGARPDEKPDRAILAALVNVTFTPRDRTFAESLLHQAAPEDAEGYLQWYAAFQARIRLAIADAILDVTEDED